MNVSDDHPLQLAVEIIAGRWRASIIYFLFNRSMRFSDLEEEIPNISQRMLSLDLRKLEKDGILTRTVIDEKPIKVEYRLTAEGTNLSAVLHRLHSWEQNFKGKRRPVHPIAEATP